MRYSQFVWPLSLLLFIALISSPQGLAQTEARQAGAVLGEQIFPASVSLHQIKQYILARVAKPPAPASAQQWTEEARRLREHLLNEVVFHGWPKEWTTSPPRFGSTGARQMLP